MSAGRKCPSRANVCGGQADALFRQIDALFRQIDAFWRQIPSTGIVYADSHAFPHETGGKTP